MDCTYLLSEHALLLTDITDIHQRDYPHLNLKDQYVWYSNIPNLVEIKVSDGADSTTFFINDWRPGHCLVDWVTVIDEEAGTTTTRWRKDDLENLFDAQNVQWLPLAPLLLYLPTTANRRRYKLELLVEATPGAAHEA